MTPKEKDIGNILRKIVRKFKKFKDYENKKSI